MYILKAVSRMVSFGDLVAVSSLSFANLVAFRQASEKLVIW